MHCTTSATSVYSAANGGVQFPATALFNLSGQGVQSGAPYSYAELKKVRDELRDLTVHKANYEELRDLEEREKRKEKEHGRE